MDRFKTVLNIAHKQSNFGFGLVALLTAGGEQIFSSVVFQCPCNELNFLYGMVFLLVPALALLLLGYILSKRMWKLLTGVCQDRAKLGRWKNLLVAATAFFQISTTAMVAPSSWIAVALLSGNFYECAMTGTNLSAYNQHVCKGAETKGLCETELHRLPCGRGSQVPQGVRDDVLHAIRAESQYQEQYTGVVAYVARLSVYLSALMLLTQKGKLALPGSLMQPQTITEEAEVLKQSLEILGWLLIASIMLSNLLLICMARCTSPISYLQLKFWKTYTHEESELFHTYSATHAKKLAERNLESFFKQTPPGDFTTPSNMDWERISALYKFRTKDHYYSTLHQYVENQLETDMASVRSNRAAGPHAVLDFVDGGTVSL